MINIIKKNNVESIGETVADEILDIVKRKPNATLCLCTGNSPTSTYDELVKKIKDQNINCDNLKIIKLDEWVGLKENDTSSCEYYLKQKILNPLNIKEENYISINSSPTSIIEEIKKLNDKIITIDAIILGMGRNGHIGLNEPADELIEGVHVVALHELTTKHEMLKGKSKVTKGITLGFKNMFLAEKVFLIITGEGKKEAFSNFLTNKISTQNPSTLLKLHKNIDVYVDKSSLDN